MYFCLCNYQNIYENRFFKRDAYIEVSLLHPRHRFAKTRTRRGKTDKKIPLSSTEKLKEVKKETIKNE